MATQIKVIAKSELETAEESVNNWLQNQPGISDVRIDLKVYTTKEPDTEPYQWFTFVIQYDEAAKQGGAARASKVLADQPIFR